jgi:hypothetical protein
VSKAKSHQVSEDTDRSTGRMVPCNPEPLDPWTLDPSTMGPSMNKCLGCPQAPAFQRAPRRALRVLIQLANKVSTARSSAARIAGHARVSTRHSIPRSLKATCFGFDSLNLGSANAFSVFGAIVVDDARRAIA